MNALVAMHGFWALLFLPMAAIGAWRLPLPLLSAISRLTLYILTLGFIGWIGILMFNGTELTHSIQDRILHAIGVVTISVNLPLLQLIAAIFLYVKWPNAWKYGRS